MEYQQQQQNTNYQQSISQLPISNPNEKTLLWQQPYTESGYNTGAPSISSITSLLIDDQMDMQQQQQQSIPVQFLPPQQQQPAADWTSMQSNAVPQLTQLDNKKQIAAPPPVAVQQQQQPVESDNALQNWMNYQDSNEMTLKAIPELIKLLNDEDLLVVGQAAMLVNQMSKKKNSCLALIETPDCLVSLVNCLANDRNIETAKHVVATFYNISMYPQGINAIIGSNAIQALVNLLSIPMETVVSYAITTLHNVLLACGEIKVQLRKLGGIQKMVPLLTRHKNAKFLAIVVDCLQLLSHGHSESKLLLLEYGGPGLLIDILRSSNYPKLILMTMRLLKVLSVCTQNKKALINCGAMQVLSLHLNNANHSELQNCLITLRNLSDAATKINGLEVLMENLIKLASSPNDTISTLAAGILSNLTCNNEMNKIAVLKSNGIQILIGVIEKSFNKPELIEPCICTLRHITNRHQEALRAQEEMKNFNGLPLLTNLLGNKPTNWSLVKATLGVVRNFAANVSNLQYLKNVQAIEKTMQTLFDAYTEAQQRQVVNEVNLMDIIDASANIVLLLMKDYANQIHMKNINCIPFFVQLLNTPHDKIQHIAAGLLAEMAQNKECVSIIDQQPTVHFYLNQSFNRVDGMIDSNAKTLLFHINEFKSMSLNRFMPPQEQNNWNMLPQMIPPPQHHEMYNEYNQAYEQQQHHQHDFPPMQQAPPIYQQPDQQQQQASVVGNNVEQQSNVNSTEQATATTSKTDQTTKQTKPKKKRKLKNATKNTNASKKPRKASNQRRNIKKIITEQNLNQSTLQALQEEQERKQRLQVNNIHEEEEDEEEEDTDEERKKEEFIVKEEQVVQQEEPLLLLPDIQNEIEITSTDLALKREDSDNTDSDIIVLDSSIEEYKQNNNNSNKQQQHVAEIEDDTTGNDEDDDDDCQIISDSEELLEQKKPAKKGVHTDDDLNITDASGHVLVNMNHPSEDPNIYLAEHLSKRIKSHQIGGIRFLYDNIIESVNRVKNKSAGFGCILAHSMGLGKTFQIVTFTDVFLRYTEAKRVLCIVPINTIQNWFHEFNYWLPENSPKLEYKRPFKVFLLNDNVRTFAQRSDVIMQWRKQGGVMLIGYEMFRTFITMKACRQRKAAATTRDPNCIDVEQETKNSNIQEEIRETLLTPCLVVCDEGHRIKNNSANIAKTLKCIKTKRRIVLTGYPLQNNLIEYWCMVDFVRPSYLGTKAEFCNMFERPIMNGQCVDSTMEDVRIMRYRAHVLHTLLEGFVQRRGHDVFLRTLPPKQEYVILVRMTSIQKDLYLAFMESIGAMVIGEKQNPLRAFAICCKIWNHPDVLYDFIMSNKDSTAAADLDFDLPELQQQKKCGANSKNTGSVASVGEDVLADSLDTLSNDYMMNYTDLKTSKTLDCKWAFRVMENYKTGIIENAAKLMIAFSLIEQSISCGDKILLFSQSLLTLNLIESFLSKYNVPNTKDKWEKNRNYYRIDGSTSGLERERLINSFNEKDNGVWLFLLSTRAGCLGINLVGANRVIIFDASFNPCHDAQAVCRVYRYGQQKNSYIYRLIADNTMEKRIYDRQISKQSVSDRVVDEIQGENHFTRTEVEKLIHFVKEEPPQVNLSDMSSKYNDQILVSTCTKYHYLITKEPFKHESLLLDKKEYQLSNREKRDAFRHYEIEKRIPLNYSKSAYAAAYFAKMSSDSSRSNPLLGRSPSTMGISTYYNRPQAPTLTHSSSFTNTSTPQLNPYYSSLCTNTANNYNYNNSNINHNSNDIFRSYQQQQQQQQHQASSNNNNNNNESSLSDSSDIQIIDPNSNSNKNSPTKPETNKSALLKDVTMQRFITTTAITIPSTNAATFSTAKIIPAGQQVILLKTSKGCYLRTSDGKFYAIRNPPSQQRTDSGSSNSNNNRDSNNTNMLNYDFNTNTTSAITNTVTSAPRIVNNNSYSNSYNSTTNYQQTANSNNYNNGYNSNPSTDDFNFNYQLGQDSNTNTSTTTNQASAVDSNSIVADTSLTDFNNFNDDFLFSSGFGVGLP